MPRYRGTTEGTASLVGRLLVLMASGKETSASLADQLGVSPRTVNRYILQLVGAGWQIERVGVPTHQDYWFELKGPRIVLKKERKARVGRQGRKSQTSRQRG
ncbi:MAG: winged helix-turn-helix domain-containing protein [Planctomycetota bacterium]